MKAELNSTEINQVWTYADVLLGHDPNHIRQDCLGAEIHKEDYNKDSPCGWCAEYILSPNKLAELGACTTNILCQANIHVLQLGNYAKNVGHSIGHYEVRITRDGEENKLQKHWQESIITDYGKSELQKAFSLNKEQMDKLFDN